MAAAASYADNRKSPACYIDDARKCALVSSPGKISISIGKALRDKRWPDGTRRRRGGEAGGACCSQTACCGRPPLRRNFYAGIPAMEEAPGLKCK